MTRLPFGLALICQRELDAIVDHAARLLSERCQLIVDHEQATAIIAVQQRTIRAQDAELTNLRSAVAFADRLLGINGDA